MSHIKKELSRFLVAGISAVLTDLIFYYLLQLILSTAQAKAISFICGSVVAYLINKFWTFESHQPHSVNEIVRFCLLYSSTLTANVLANKLCLMMYHNMIFFAFLVATGVSTVLNFIGMKYWVFSREKVVVK